MKLVGLQTPLLTKYRKLWKNRLEKEKILKEYNKEHGFKLESEEIIQLLQFILTTTYFTFRGKIFRQLSETAMGSQVSPIAANIFFMEALEQQAIATAPLNCIPKLWLRYVDDNLEIVNKDCVENLTGHINKVDESGSTPAESQNPWTRKTFFSVGEHAINKGHTTDWDNVSVLDRENDWYRRAVREAIHIKRTNCTLNKDQGRHNLPSCYDKVILSSCIRTATSGHTTE